jgi:hypothetical protein
MGLVAGDYGSFSNGELMQVNQPKPAIHRRRCRAAMKDS